MSSRTPEYEQFKAKRDEWNECLIGDDRNSVRNQIGRMIWDAAVFRMINTARALAPLDDKDRLQLNGMIHGFINESFFVSQATAIRRLADTYPISGKRSVFSLIGLLDDMAKHAHLMTRDHLFAVEGLPYDPEPVKEAFFEYSRERVSKGERSFFVPKQLRYQDIDRRHETIDKLAGVDPSQRSRHDSIHLEVFVKLTKMVWDVCEDVARHVNKLIVHAASPEDRKPISLGELTITLGHLWDAHEVIYKVANFVSVYLLYGSSFGGLAIPQYNQFKYIERPLVKAENIQDLREEWQRYEKETRDWHSWGLDEFAAGKI